MKRRNKRIRLLFLTTTMTAFVLIASTYAWFVGMKTVNVSDMDIDIATTEGLYLSMDGTNWSYNLNANSAAAYTGNTNTWAPNGLIPVSTVGNMDTTASRMELFEKGSLTASTGGYRLLASRVNNYTIPDGQTKPIQGDGYVAFDLFIKNLSGSAYYPTNKPENEEAIYLTTDSAVDVARTGVRNTGIENSVRVAFAQIGRVKADVTNGTIIGNISCSDDTTNSVTGICRRAAIWEPNDKKHVNNAIEWYNTACLSRNGVTVASGSYGSDGCGTVANGTAYPTYAITRELGTGDNVDVYDGTSFNGYEGNSIYGSSVTDENAYSSYIAAIDAATPATIENVKKNYKIVKYPYLTDTAKELTGMSRPQLMSLAPNSITKVRVYVYIEGQDIDNYDFASLGKMISVKFGFTKERFIETDIGYTGPSTLITPTAGE